MLGTALLVALVAGGTTGCAASERDGVDADEPEAEVSEPATPRTEIVAQGQNATVRVEPSVDNAISGIVTITITEAPDGTVMAFFTMRKQGAEDTQVEGPNIGIDTDASDGWSSLLDTSGFENGVYEVSGLAMAGPDDDPLGGATAQVLIQN